MAQDQCQPQDFHAYGKLKTAMNQISNGLNTYTIVIYVWASQTVDTTSYSSKNLEIY